MSVVTAAMARHAKATAAERLGERPSVCGIGLTKVSDDYAVKINLAAEPPDFPGWPRVIDGVSVVYEVVGRVAPRLTG